MDKLRTYKRTGLTPQQCQWLADYYKDKKGIEEYLELKYQCEQLKIENARLKRRLSDAKNTSR